MVPKLKLMKVGLNYNCDANHKNHNRLFKPFQMNYLILFISVAAYASASACMAVLFCSLQTIIMFG